MNNSKSWLGGLIAGLVLFGVLGAIDVAWNGWRSLNWLDTIFHGHGWLFTSLAVLILIFSVGAFLFTVMEAAGSKLLGGLVAALPILALVGLVVYGVGFHGYDVKHRYSQLATTTNVSTTDFKERAPYVVAANYASRNQGDVVGDRKAVHHVPESGEESSRYTTVIEGRGFMGRHGYAAIRTYDLPKMGPISDKAAKDCLVPASMGKTWGAAWPTRSLDRSLMFKSPLSHWDSDDSYGYCDKENKPVFVQPLWRWSGFWKAIKVPAGVAVYDESGLHLVQGDALQAVEGPTFPRSLANEYRNALTASGSRDDSWSKRGGYDTTAKDANDTNEGNSSEFSLLGTDGHLYYVTPLTPRGSSQSLTAVSVVPARQEQWRGKFRVETKVELPATSSLENSIRATSVAGDPDYVARWNASNQPLRVYEMIPGKNGHWVASIGMGQLVNYRADITPAGEVTVQRLTADGTASEKPQDKVTVNTGKAVDTMTDEELIQVIQQASSELAKRHPKK